MAGGGAAAASALSSPWRALLQRALDGNAHLRHSTYFQLATVGAGGWPANRTVVFRGFQEYCDKIQINTDARSNKIGEIRDWPFGEICWYFTDSWEQFRIRGIIDVIDASNADPDKLQHREKAWFKSSVKSRLQYLGPQPGVPVVDDQQIKDVHLDPSAGPVGAFCLLVLDPEKVDYLNLKSNQRLVFTRTQKEDGSSDWMAEKDVIILLLLPGRKEQEEQSHQCGRRHLPSKKVGVAVSLSSRRAKERQSKLLPFQETCDPERQNGQRLEVRQS